MPLQNRVNPFGQLIATPERGAWTGNRGVIHNAQQQIVRNHAVKYWITCVLEYKDFRRRVMSPNRWTELFFLDEATAFAAGHPVAFVGTRISNDSKVFGWRPMVRGLD